mgnify:FL=1
MNVADSDDLRSLLIERGFIDASEPGDADLLVVNTCSVREHAENRALARIRELSALKRKDAQLWVTGCMAQRLGEELKRKIPGIGRVIGAKEIDNLENIVDSALKTKMFSSKPALRNDISDFVAVMRGCDNYCSYCIVPYVRGHEKSIPAVQIEDEIRRKIESGKKEITLLGQNVNSYNDNGIDFPDLLARIEKIEGLERIRFTTSHPKDCSEKLIATMASLEKVCRHLHLPVQAGSDRILALMNRRYTTGDYLKKIEMLRRYIPDVDITTDIMVGFPTEIESEFQETLSLVKSVCFTNAFMFAYSAREGTAAGAMVDDIPREEKISRLNRLIKIQTDITKAVYEQKVGCELDLLITGRQEKRDRMWMGMDKGCKRALLSCEMAEAGMILKAKAIKNSGMTLICERIS